MDDQITVDEAYDVSIVMPCLNEAASLGECIERAQMALAALEQQNGFTGEVVIADNGSTDGSQQIARDLGARVVEVPVKGYGAALQGGFNAARGRFLVMGDSDCSYDFLESVALVQSLAAGNDVCMGNRFKGGIKPGAMPWKNRYIGNPALSLVLRVLYNTPISDSHCGLRALTKEAYRRLNLNSQGMEFASEIVLKASTLGLRMDEQPVTLSPDKRGRAPHLRPWRDGWRHLRFMFMLSPVWLFAGPAAVVGLIGALILAALASQPDGTMVSLLGLQFGDHWLPLSIVLILSAVQLFLLGMSATVFSIREGWRRPSRALRGFLRLFRLEHWMIAGSLLMLAGGAGVGTIIYQWAGSDFGNLYALREISAWATLFAIGLQTFFGGFLLSILSGAKARMALPED